ncbi:MAG: hypothetical protein FJX77_17735, partial [Armatimonadetes bacterium]|nr:hypothetical protein [Armatimonadota bacterium]
MSPTGSFTSGTGRSSGSRTARTSRSAWARCKAPEAWPTNGSGPRSGPSGVAIVMPVENLVHRRHRNRRAGLVALLGVLAGVLAPLGLLAQGNPSYSPEETTTEYDVDPAWPKRPAGMKEPEWVSGLALDAQENVWLFTKGPDPVQVYRPDGSFLRTWGQGQFNQPHQLRIDREGNVWVADFGLHVVQKYTPEGKLLLTLGTRGAAGEDATHFNRPTDMAIAPNGDVFVTDGYGNRRVVHFDRNGRYLRAWGTFGSAPGQFVLPHAIQMDSRGRLYVADRNSGRIQVFNQKGKLLDVWSGLLMPWGLFITPQDEVWVCGSTPHWWFRKG